MMASLKPMLKDWLARSVWAYQGEDVARQLKRMGIEPGSTLMVHASWHAHNGFRGKPADLVKVLKSVVGAEGLLVMPSMPYHNMSSAQWLAKGKPMNVRSSPSLTGLLSEVFRRSEQVQRSLSATHPLLAWGRDANSFIAGHEHSERPFGPDSPFAHLVERNALILGFDAPFSAFTFTHFVEDQLGPDLPVPLYAPEPMMGKVIDLQGHESMQSIRVISAQANQLRREERLVAYLKQAGLLQQGRIGNTALVWIRAPDLLAGARRMIQAGSSFFDHP